MAGDKMPSLYALDKPEDLKELMRQDRGDDCLSCTIVGKSPLPRTLLGGIVDDGL